jgi:ATP-dependent Clp protease, protease subunit
VLRVSLIFAADRADLRLNPREDDAHMNFERCSDGRQGRTPAPEHNATDPALMVPNPLMGPVHYQRTREMTIDELLLENRVVFLIGEINYSSAARAMMQMLYLENQKKGQDINLYINSHGGTVDDTLAIYDTMQFLSADVATYCIGRAYSGACLVLAAGAKGKRYILPHAKVMIHQPLGGVGGQAEDIRIQAEQIIKSKKTLAEILARHSGRPVEQVLADSERDKFFTAMEAKEYGLVDEVLQVEPPAASAGGTKK